MTPIVLNLRSLRLAQGLSQVALGRLAKVRQVTVSAYEQDSKRRVDLDILARLAKALGVAPAALLGWQRPAPRPKATRKPRPPRKP